jgi:hypothetical protein
MADEKKAEAAAPAAAKPAAGAKKGGALGFMILMVVCGALVPFVYPTLFLFAGMAPSLLALLALNNDKQGASISTVGIMNAAALTPFIIELWVKGQTMEASMRILCQADFWMVMFGAAGVGQLIYFAVPQAITSLTLARAEARVQLLKQHLETLKGTWGPDVATTKPMEKATRGS